MAKKLIGSGKCVFCGKDNRVEVDEKHLANFNKWKRREMLIQEAMPGLKKEEREVLISEICIKCQKDIFG